MPPNPIRDAVGDERVASYVQPLFDQKWSVFAPSPGVSDSSLVVRAFVGEPGEEGESTEWLDIDRRAQSQLRFDLTPPRMRTVGRRLSGLVAQQLNAMSDQQRRLVQGHYSKTSIAELGKRLEEASPGYDADGYLLEEARLATFGSLIARAVWGDDVALVQFKVAVHSVPPFADREAADYGSSTQETLIGWRAAKDVPSDVQEAFDDYVAGGF